MNGACVAQIFTALERIRNTLCSQGQMNECHRLLYCYIEHRWGTRGDVKCFHPNIQAQMFCYQFEPALRLAAVLDSIQREADKNRQPCKQMIAWIRINKRGLLQRYAQEFERKCGTGTIIYCKGDLFQLIKNAGGFVQNENLWDSPRNLRRMFGMQNETLARHEQLGAITRLYGGEVSGQYVLASSFGTEGHPKKFYAPLPKLSMLELYADEDVSAMVGRHFKLGMPRLELGQFLIANGADVDITKEGRQLQQARERGAQCTELQTGRRGMVMALEQINTYRSVLGSEMGDPVPIQQLPTTLDEVVPPTAATAFKEGFFRRPLLVAQFKIDQKAPRAVVRPPSRGSSPAVSSASSVGMGEGAADIARRARAESLSPGTGAEQRDQRASRDTAKKTTPATRAVGRGIPSPGSSADWPKEIAAPPVKPVGRGRGGFDAHPAPAPA
ncbi:MAG: hypothetical protein GY835_16270, partial [bacterium]|nr:hypothetical protein [bacterium]